MGDSFASQRTLVRHYSFFMDMQQGGAVVPTPSAIPGDHSLNHALSLLMHTLATDIQMEKVFRTLNGIALITLKEWCVKHRVAGFLLSYNVLGLGHCTDLCIFSVYNLCRETN